MTIALTAVNQASRRLNQYANLSTPLVAVQILLFEVPIEGKEKKKKKVLLATKIQAGGDKSKSILDYVDATVRPVTNAQGFIGEYYSVCSHSDIMSVSLHLLIELFSPLQGSVWCT